MVSRPPHARALATDISLQFTGPGSAFIEYSGYLMANDCGIISQNGLTQDPNQMCNGGYYNGADVTCDGSGKYVNFSPLNDHRTRMY